MDNKITDALKTATKDILTEDVLKEIEFPHFRKVVNCYYKNIKLEEIYSKKLKQFSDIMEKLKVDETLLQTAREISKQVEKIKNEPSHCLRYTSFNFSKFFVSSESRCRI